MNEKQGQFSAERLELSQITVTIRTMEDVKRTAAALESLLLQFHSKKDYSITVPLELLEKAEATKRIFNLVLGSIAGISLIVGGIGIMNIMLASILERIREIGVRRAVGASQKDILAQFLSEAVLISLAGGVAGILVGGGLSLGIERIAKINTIVSFFSVFIAFGVSITVGVVFGFVPAWRAAKQDPVVCLRYE